MQNYQSRVGASSADRMDERSVARASRFGVDGLGQTEPVLTLNAKCCNLFYWIGSD
jgi:hypothetical protein